MSETSSCKLSHEFSYETFYPCIPGFAQLLKYLNIQDCLEKSLKIKFALKST